jgi:hypothetical protein
LVLIPSAVKAQQIPQKVRSLQPVLSILGVKPNAGPGARFIKSGTPLIALSHIRRNQLSVESRTTIAETFQVTDMQTSRLSPSGKFRIHYDTSGINTPALLNPTQSTSLPNTYEAYVDSVGAIFDYCWTFQIDSLGYRPPASDGGWGGGPEYDVFIQNLDPSLFGYTMYDDSTRVNPSSNPPRYWAYTVVDNDYLGYRTPGMNGLRATAAHEFQHAIHLGGYGMWDNRDIYFYELSAGWMEGVNFPSVHDYYFDVSEYFTGFHGLPFYYLDAFYIGSERGIWGQYLTARFGRDAMRDIWEREAAEQVIPSINDALIARGSDFATEFTLFSFWNYYTADRADPLRYYPEGIHYPRYAPSGVAPYSSGGTASIMGQPDAFSTSFFEFRLPADTITAIIANVDLAAALQYDVTGRSVQLELGTSIGNLATQNLPGGLKIGFGAADLTAWTEHYVESSTGSLVVNANSNASPNPLRLSSGARLSLPVNEPANSSAQVYVLSAAMTMQFSAGYTVSNALGGRFVYIPASELQAHLASGIYFIIARINQTEYRWKVAVVR